MLHQSSTTLSHTDRPFPYHSSYGLSDSFRMEVVLESYALSPKQAAKNNGVSLSSVYKWRRDCKIEVTPRLLC